MVEQIIEVLRLLVPKVCQLREACYNQIGDILVEKNPQTVDEMREQIGDILKRGSALNQQEITTICQNLFNKLTELQLIKVEDKKPQPSSDRLQQIKPAVNTAYEVMKNPKKDKQKKKEEAKALEDYENYLESVKSQKSQIPPSRVRHDRNLENKCLDIMLDKLSIIMGGKVLLEDTSLKIVHGRKYGLAGRNGIGKTCLMDALARFELENMPEHVQILLVEQEIQGSDKTAVELVLETDMERLELMEEATKLEDNMDEESGMRLGDIYERLDHIEAHLAEDKAKAILKGLGFSQELMERKTKHLSGGWRMRVSLARALFVQPDVLLLDEPTNHLDLDAVMWLEDYVMNCSHSVVIVSHAREFLNIVCNEIIHFYDRKLTHYKGNYDMFEKTRFEKLSNQKKQYEKQQDQIEHMQSFIDKFRANAKRASLVQSRVKAIEKMEKVEEVVDDSNCTFIFPNPEHLTSPLLWIEDGNFSYGTTQILKGLNIAVEMDSRLAIVGANGAGKSTFLNLLLDNLKLNDGKYFRNARLRVSMFTQHHVEQLNLMLSPLEQLQHTFPGEIHETYRAHLSSFGLTGLIQLRPQYLLSGGQKSRVAFALAVWYNPHILIMDEPTNHLDIDAINALIEALNNFTGGLIIVSHDQYFVSQVCDQIWYIKEKQLKKFNGEFDDYKKKLTNGTLP